MLSAPKIGGSSDLERRWESQPGMLVGDRVTKKNQSVKDGVSFPNCKNPCFFLRRESPTNPSYLLPTQTVGTRLLCCFFSQTLGNFHSRGGCLSLLIEASGADSLSHCRSLWIHLEDTTWAGNWLFLCLFETCKRSIRQIISSLKAPGGSKSMTTVQDWQHNIARVWSDWQQLK